jgi:ribosome recycling factor
VETSTRTARAAIDNLKEGNQGFSPILLKAMRFVALLLLALAATVQGLVTGFSGRGMQRWRAQTSLFAKGKGEGKSTAEPTGFDWKGFKKGTEDKMAKSLESIQSQFNTLRAGGANAAMLDRVFVDFFGTPTPLSQVARVGTSGSQQLVIEPFDKTICKEIEKAISTSDLNLTPTNDGSGIVRINVPPLTEDRRKELAKQAKVISEDGKVAVRNHRRDAVDKIKDLEKGKAISKDDAKGFQGKREDDRTLCLSVFLSW